MKNLLFKGLAMLLFIFISTSGYADAIRMTAINESSQSATLTINALKNQTIAIGSADVTQFTADYQYPAPILLQSRSQSPISCHWSMPPMGKQTITAITVSISIDKSTNAQSCLLSWQ